MSNPSPTSGISGHHSVVGGRGGGGHGILHHRSTESLDSLSDESNHHRNRTPASRQVYTTLYKPMIVAWLITSTFWFKRRFNQGGQKQSNVREARWEKIIALTKGQISTDRQGRQRSLLFPAAAPSSKSLEGLFVCVQNLHVIDWHFLVVRLALIMAV